MGRPEPCVLFAQSFLHPQLDEYVDEVIFAEPIVITACEFLEQNASSSALNIPLTGATSPPSFALEIFVHCEGESRFRRLCQPFLYSQSSSNVLDVEAIVTSHLILRGSYRNLTLVIYGNTAEDLGQFNIELDLDNSLANVVCSPSEGKLEDLPPALCSAKLTFDESISSIKYINFPVAELDIPLELKQFLFLSLSMCQNSDDETSVFKVVDTVVSAISSYIMSNNRCKAFCWDRDFLGSSPDIKINMSQVVSILAEATNELMGLLREQKMSGNDCSSDDLTNIYTEANLADWELLVDMYNSCQFFRKTSSDKTSVISQEKNFILGFGLALLFCSYSESCFHFVDHGGMEQISSLLHDEIQISRANTLLLLTFVECATHHGIGCEGFLGWWPRIDDSVPVTKSDGYCHLLKLLLGKDQHDVASLSTYLLQRLRLYEIACRYESVVLSLLGKESIADGLFDDGIESLLTASSQLKQIRKLIDLCDPIDDPSPVTFARKLSQFSLSDGLLSYKSSVKCIAASKCSFTRWDMDACLLSLLKERGFLPLSTALLSSPVLRSLSGRSADVFLDIVASVESIILSLLFHRSGLSFLLSQPEATALLIHSLQDVEDMAQSECMTLRQASAFLMRGFMCHPQEVATIVELHLKVGIAIDRLITTSTRSDELLWVLWELCAISRSDSGRQALLVTINFEEAVSLLLDALCSSKDMELIAADNGASPLSLAIFHSASEIFEVIVTDPTASSLKSWIEHAVALHKALHSSSPGSNKKDAPARLLEWIDAGVVYHRNGAIGLLRYAALLASGGDAHLSSTSVLVSDSVDIENVVGDSTSTPDSHIMDSLLGKLISDKYFEGVTLRDSSIVQLTTAFRILAFISEDSAVAASLFEEGAMTLIYVVLVNYKSMLERLSNSYDFLVDEGADYNSTTDLLLERSHEEKLVDLMVPSLLFLINILKKLQESKEQYRNKKLLNALLQLHREVSPKLAACAAGLNFPHPCSALGLGVVCHLLTSALASWPIFSWSPGLFHCILDSVQSTSSLALGPKDACSILCLLGDLFPDEGIWMWRNEIPPLSTIRTLSVGTMLGSRAESNVNWYLQPEYITILLVRLTPQLDRIAQIILHFSFTALVVIQDMLRVFVIRIACQRMECAVVLLRPVISWLNRHIEDTSLSEMEIFKVYQLLQFLAGLLEHPYAKASLCKVGTQKILGKALMRYSSAIQKCRDSSKMVSLSSWCLPLLKSLTLLFSPQMLKPTDAPEMCIHDDISAEECCLLVCHLLKICQCLPVGKDLLACIATLKELVSCPQGRVGLAHLISLIQYSAEDEDDQDERSSNGNILKELDWQQYPPFLGCLQNLLRSLEDRDCDLTIIVEILCALSSCSQFLAMKFDEFDGVFLLKFLCGIPLDVDDVPTYLNEKFDTAHEIMEKIDHSMEVADFLWTLIGKAASHQVKESVNSMLSLLKTLSSPKTEAAAFAEGPQFSSDGIFSLHLTSQLTQLSDKSVNESILSFPHVWKSNQDAEQTRNDLHLRRVAEHFMWECSDSSIDRQLMPTSGAKRKLSLAEGSSRRTRENPGPDGIGLSVFSRSLSTATIPSGPTRRDTFRQRKPNTSRPPSMHVDDYVARERNIDVASSGSNIISSFQRGGSSGRPPSIHVDEFMARQRERQNPMSVTVGDASQTKSTEHVNPSDSIKLEKPQQMKANLDDDLQGIDIVFDEESESDDRLPFPQPDENLNPPTVIGESSPSLVIEETGDSSENTRFTSSATGDVTDHHMRSGIPHKRSVPESEILISRNSNSEENFAGTGLNKSFRESSEEKKFVSHISGSRGIASQHSPSFPLHHNVSSVSPSIQSVSASSFYQRNSPRKGPDGSVASASYGDQKLSCNHPPLPSTPPPAILSAQAIELTQSHTPFANTLRDVQPPVPSGYPPQAFDVGSVAGAHLQSESSLSAGNSSFSNTQPNIEAKFPFNMGSGARPPLETPLRPLPPLPPMPPPLSVSMTHPSTVITGSQTLSSNLMTGTQIPMLSTSMSETGLGIFASGANLSSYPFSSPLLIGRPGSAPGSFFGSTSLQNSQNSSSFLQSASSQTSLQSLQSRAPPPPPPQVPRPLQHPGPLSHTHSDQAMPFQHTALHVPLQIQQQVHIPPMQFYYQSQPQEPLLQPVQQITEQARQESHNTQAENALQQQKDSGMTLQQYFSSPEAIQSLLSDREKLCQLLEQHPKLMQMLQERLGQQ